MATYTTHYNLTKQAGSENMNVHLLNDNFDKIDNQINQSRPLQLVKTNVSTLPATIVDNRITETMICPRGGMILSNPNAQLNEWTVTTYNGSVEITGSIYNTTTDITLWLEEPMA